MTTQSPIHAAPARRRHLPLIAITVAILTIAVCAVGAKMWFGNRAPTPDASPDRLAAYMATPAFKSLPDAQKRPYLDAFARADRNGQISSDQRKAVLGNVIPPIQEGPIADYFALPPGKEREHFLDNVIDKQMKIESGKTAPPLNRSGNRPPGAVKLQGEGLAQSISPEDRARMDQFMQDLHNRRKARGIPDNGTVLFTR